MTPFAWSASEAIKDTLKSLKELDIEADFIVTLAVKSWTLNKMS